MYGTNNFIEVLNFAAFSISCLSWNVCKNSLVNLLIDIQFVALLIYSTVNMSSDVDQRAENLKKMHYLRQQLWMLQCLMCHLN